MVGRNDPCPCGSGKKYKKCCGKEQVVDLQEILISELEKIMVGFAEEGLEPANYFEVEQRTHQWKKVLAPVFDEALIEAAAYEAYIYHDRVDIWQKYIARQKKHQKRQRIIDILSSWERPFFLLAEIQKIEGENLIVRDLLTSETYQFPGAGQGQPGEWLFGLVMPNPLENEKELQPTSAILFIPKHQKAVVEGIHSKLESGIHDSLDLYRVFIEQSHLSELPLFETGVLELVDCFLTEHDFQNDLPRNMAHSFLAEFPLSARKPEGVAAGVLQAINLFGFLGELDISQKNLAEYFGTSVASLTKYRDLMENYLMDRIQLMSEGLKSLDSDLDFDMDIEPPLAVPQILMTMGTDPRITERDMWQMAMRVQHSDAATEEELNRIIQQSTNASYSPANDSEAAQLVSYQAYEARTEKERQQLAKKAFQLDPDNTDANLLMAEITQDSAEKHKHYQKALQIAMHNSDLEKEIVISWDYVLHRPLLRTLFAYGAWLMTEGRYAEASHPLGTLLELNPADQQGARWLLASAFIRGGKWEDAEELLSDFPPEEYESIDFYFDSIMEMHNGTLDDSELEELSGEAIIWNSKVLDLIESGKDPGNFPRSLSLENGNEDEAKLIYWLIYGMPGIHNFL